MWQLYEIDADTIELRGVTTRIRCIEREPVVVVPTPTPVPEVRNSVATIQWSAPDRRNNDEQLPPSEIDYYIVSYADLSFLETGTSHVSPSLPTGDYEVRVSAVDIDGVVGTAGTDTFEVN